MTKEERKDISHRVWESDEVINILDRLGPDLLLDVGWAQFKKEIMGEYERLHTEFTQRRPVEDEEREEDEHSIELGVGA